MALLVGLSGSGLVRAASATTLDAISYSTLPGNRLEVKLELSDDIAKPLTFAIDRPPRVALDFPGVSSNLAVKTQAIGVGMAHSVTAVEARGRTRVVLNLVSPVPYAMRVDGSDVYLTLENPGAVASSTGPTTLQRSSSNQDAQIEDVDFRRGENGEGRIIVQLSDPATVVDTREEAGNILVDFIGVALPEQLKRRLDVTDFATPVSRVDTFAEDGNVRVVIAASGLFEHLAYQADNRFTVEVKPLDEREMEKRKKETFGYTGERLSLNFQDIEVRAVLQLIADFTGLNLVASDTVGGNLTLRLKNVPWDQALDIILKTKGLGMRQSGNVVLVAPAEEIAAREKLELEAEEQIRDLAPLRTEFVQVNYAKASDLATLLKADENSLMSERGNVAVDERTNTLLVRDTADNLASIRELVATLDIPVRQVMIESRIVIADDGFSRDLGVKFGYSKTGTYDDNFFTLGGKLTGDTEFLDSAGNPVTTGFSTDNQENFIVDLPIADPAAALGVVTGKLGSWLVQMELQALQEENRGEVLANPRVITSNQKEAVIEQGTEIPYQEATSSGATSTSFKKAVLSLKVVPQITPDDRIIMDLEVNQDSVGETTPAGPAIDTQSVTTQVLVDNGETVVLGGIFERTLRDDVEKVPFFGDLPMLGYLFKQTSTRDAKRELLIFVTPKILKDTLSL
jgi:type IV pilus assembly protein PilQ